MSVPYLGNFSEDATVYIPFNTFSSNDPQASVTITNLADADLKVHKDGGLTQIVTDGATIAIDFDSITGNHLATIDTSAHADYSIGSDYHVRMEGTTVDGATINAWIGHFSIENRFNEVAVVAWNGVALGTTNPLPNAAADAAGGLPISDAGGLDLDAMNVNINDIETDTADMQPKLGTPTGASISADIADVPTVAELNARTLAAASYFDPAADTVATVTTLSNKTGFSLAATGLDAIVSTATGMVEIAKSVWDRVLTGATHNINNSSGRRLRQLEAGFVVASGTAQAGAANTITLAAGESASDNIFRGDRVIIVGGTGISEHGIIVGYVGSTKVCTMSENWVITPDNTSEYELTPADVDVETWQHVVVSNSATTSLPAVDAQSISDSATAADDLQANIAILADWANGGRLDLILDIIAADTTTDIPASIAALQDISAAQVLTQVNAALDTAISELGVAAPTATPNLRTGLMLMYMALRNKTIVQTSGTDALEIHNSAGTKITSKILTDLAGDFKEAKMT